MSRWTKSVVLVALLAAPAALRAQVPRPPRPPAPPGTTGAQRRDSTRGDTVKVKELVKWSPPDSVMNSLLSRPGFTVTRYQGQRVTLRRAESELKISGKAAVERERTIVVGDTLIYNDSLRTVIALGDTVTVRDPQNAADVVAYHSLTYDLINRRGIAKELSTSVSEGQTWYVHAHGGAAFQQDTTGNGHNASYVRGGTITSCDLTEPHYHFEAGQIKLIQGQIMVARPAVLYIAEVPVLWLPFIFQDMRKGRRSGIITPRFGLVDIVRTSPTYRRTIENVGYYFALSEYMDATVSLDWRSGARDALSDPGWMRYNGEWRYRWLDRFLSGRIGITKSTFTSGSENTALNWDHTQDFSQNSRLSMSLNYATNTIAQRQQALTVLQALGTIASTLNFQNKYGPAVIATGGNFTQHVGRKQRESNFPEVSVTTEPLNLAKWLVWTPGFRLSNRQTFEGDAVAQFAQRYFNNPAKGGALDSVAIAHSSRNTTASLSTPLRIFDFDLQNSFDFSEVANNFPETRVIYRSPRDTANPTTRVFERTFLTSLDWQTSFGLPHFSPGRWNISPSVGFTNVAPGAFLVRSERTGGAFVHQAKRPNFAISASPTIFGLFPGFGPFSRIRHSVNALVSFNYAPSGNNLVSDDYLQALGMRRIDFEVGALQQSAISLGLNQTFEAKVRAPADSAPEAGQKIQLLQLNTSPISYDFERARKTHHTGFTSSSFTIGGRSDLLPGFDMNFGYSLFQGDVNSDSAKFKPYLTDIGASFSIGRDRNPLQMLSRLLGRSVPEVTPAVPEFSGGQTVQTPFGPQQQSIAGTSSSRLPLGIDDKRGWEATFRFSSRRQRPPVGSNVVFLDPAARCDALVDPITKLLCQTQARGSQDSIQTTTRGGPVYYSPPVTNLTSSLTFNITQKWSAQWNSGYDFERSQFSDHQVTLQRDLHDWRAIFGFLRAPNGNFAFTFFISLKAEPDLKFNYDRRTYRPQQ
ncbi:MAG: hypothetical protein M3081_00795 [Gemmatimonadota bacterium]|nr:hypothetical protein [Gemmatimonadota bacterium]